jgi:hypothetical protein
MFALSYLIQRFSGFAFPLMGSDSLSLSQGMAPNGVNINVAVSAGFGWPFYFAIVVAGLCVAARLYHRKIVADIMPPPTTTKK